MQREKIMEVSDLAALPRGRAILTSSGMPAGLIDLQHYSSKPYSQDIEDSKSYYEGVATQKVVPKPR